MAQDKLEELLKKKGIGPLGSKSLSEDEVKLATDLLLHSDVSLITKATMLTALLTLEANPYEAALLAQIKASPKATLPAELGNFIIPDLERTFQNLVNKTIKKEDLNTEEATRAMDFFFDAKEPDYLKAAFLEAQRLKRETFTENQAFFNAMWKRAERITINQQPIIHLCDSFDGSNRTRNFSVFVAALIAAAGFRCVVSSIDSVAPKNGITSHQILHNADKKTLLNIEDASTELQNLGWTYIDQAVSFPALYAMKDLRKEMVKRPFIATFEKLLQPIRSSTENYIVTGYTHSHYRQELVNLLKEQKQCTKAIILRGMEGSTHISMNKESICVQLNSDIISDSLVSPQQFGLPVVEEKQDKSIVVQTSLDEGISALNGENNYARQSILYLTAIILSKFELLPLHNLVSQLSILIDNGSALQKFNKKA
jgi:anthranilate phosphoribosyltransferase